MLLCFYIKILLLFYSFILLCFILLYFYIFTQLFFYTFILLRFCTKTSFSHPFCIYTQKYVYIKILLCFYIYILLFIYTIIILCIHTKNAFIFLFKNTFMRLHIWIFTFLHKNISVFKAEMKKNDYLCSVIKQKHLIWQLQFLHSTLRVE